MRKFLCLVSVVFASLLLAGCYTSATHSPNAPAASSSVAPAKINCKALERQELYNETNMNTEVTDTTIAQRQALKELIAKNCKNQ